VLILLVPRNGPAAAPALYQIRWGGTSRRWRRRRAAH